MTNQEPNDEYLEKYKNVVSYYLQYDSIQQDIMLNQKTYLGDKQNRVCRFCGKNSREVKFKKIAHAIPEMLGNHYLCTYYECDQCNELFSKLENDLGWFTELGRAMTSLNGKYGPPTLKQGESSIRDENGELLIRDYAADPIMEWIGENELRVSAKSKTFTPVAVYKAFTKMALTLMPEGELIHFKESLKWIQEQDHTAMKVPQLIAFSSFIPGSAFQGVGYKLFFRKDGADSQLPYCQFVLKFYNFMYQIYIPFSEKDIGPECRFRNYPPEFDLGLTYPFKITTRPIDLSIAEKVRGSEQFVTIGFSTKVDVTEEFIEKENKFAE